jgi:hypothetical protein
MTVTRTAIAGAVVLNIPTLIYGPRISAVAAFAAVLALATIGAALGALLGSSFFRHEPAAVAQLPTHEVERRAA